MEAVNLATARAAKRTQNLQDPTTKGTKRPEAASNALLDVTSKEALEEWPVRWEIIVIPQTQMTQMDDVNVLEIPADEAAHEDNKAAIQLIKEQTLDNAHCEVEFQLDLCGGVISYQDLLKHLSVAFQGGDNKANLPVEFYSHAQKVKESEEAFADELQILAHKVIIKKPDFRVNLDTTLKQHYASQLLDRNSASIAKTLLVQTSKCSFTEFIMSLLEY